MAAAGHPAVAQAEAEDIRGAAIPVVDTLVEVTPAAVTRVVAIPAAIQTAVVDLMGAGMLAVVTRRLTKSLSN